jgi:ADP-ribose pyrophosphatase
MSQQDDKPNSRHYGWQLLETSYPFVYRMFDVRQDLVRWPDGREAPYCYVEGKGAVWIVPVLPSGDLILIRQFRYTVDDWCWEVPAGGFHDFQGSPIDLAQQELGEEVGGSSDEWLHVGSFRPGVSITEEICHIVLAWDVRLDQEPHREAAEIIEVHQVPFARAIEMARSGEMVDGHSALALLRSEPYIQSRLRQSE